MLTQEGFIHIFMLVIEVADETLAYYAYLLQSVEIHQQITHGWNEILPLIHITRLWNKWIYTLKCVDTYESATTIINWR
jgi:hypothetical protein